MGSNLMADFSLEKCGDLAPQGPAPHGQSSAGRQHPPPTLIQDMTFLSPIPCKFISAPFMQPS